MKRIIIKTKSTIWHIEEAYIEDENLTGEEIYKLFTEGLDIEFCEEIDGSCEPLKPSENDGQATIKIYDENRKLLFANGKIPLINNDGDVSNL